jgi:hypothetical protein
VEKPGEVVRNHAVGTHPKPGRPRIEAEMATSTREWTPESRSTEGRTVRTNGEIPAAMSAKQPRPERSPREEVRVPDWE